MQIQANCSTPPRRPHQKTERRLVPCADCGSLTTGTGKRRYCGDACRQRASYHRSHPGAVRRPRPGTPEWEDRQQDKARWAALLAEQRQISARVRARRLERRAEEEQERRARATRRAETRQILREAEASAKAARKVQAEQWRALLASFHERAIAARAVALPPRHSHG